MAAGPSKTVIRSERVNKALIDWRVPRDRERSVLAKTASRGPSSQ